MKSLFADIMKEFEGYAIGKMLRYLSDPSVISFAGGLPSSDVFPLDIVKKATEKSLKEDWTHVLQYTPIPGEKDLAFREANSLLATRHWPEAEDAFRGILDSSPHYQEAKLGLARALLAQGSGCEAQELLQEIQQGPGLAQVNPLDDAAASVGDGDQCRCLRSLGVARRGLLSPHRPTSHGEHGGESEREPCH